MEATFYFDPACPWTWRASRWLTQVAASHDVSVRWRAFSLGILSGDNMPEQYRAPVAASSRALRLVEALAAHGRHDETARFYTEIGTRVHDGGADLTDKLVDEAADAAGIGDARAALDDETWDAAVRQSHETAYASAGPDIGSPVLTVDDAARGLHGPILATVPSPEESAALWHSLLPLLHSRVFFEVKRGRRD
jgi:2-hydroxychromene-2-carboxylate isomerase